MTGPKKLSTRLIKIVPDRIRETAAIRLWAISKIPMLAWVRPKIISVTEAEAIVVIPLTRRTKNHLNSMYFGVLACGADLAGGILAMRLINKAKAESGDRISLVFKDFKADFLKRPEHDVVFSSTDGPLVAEMVAEAQRTGARISNTVSVIATCPAKLGDEPVARFELTLSLKRKI